jgi:hypothetical protein
MALSKKLRFEVFKRDGFRCQYCGQHPPTVILEADHVLPKSKGGSDDINNLVTSCFDCNRGKSANELTSVPLTVAQNVKLIKEREAQYKEYLKLLKRVDEREGDEIDHIEKVFQRAFPKYSFKPAFRMSVKKFIKLLGLSEVQDSMEYSLSRVHDVNKVLTYFCGVCWGKIKRENG